MTTSEIVLDAYGLLVHPEDWNRDLAQSFADELGLGPLTEDHWRIIDYVRGRYLKCQAIHPAQQVCRHFGLPKKCVWDLFGGPLELWKVAGLPYPGTEAYTYMENEDPWVPPGPVPASMRGVKGCPPGPPSRSPAEGGARPEAGVHGTGG